MPRGQARSRSRTPRGAARRVTRQSVKYVPSSRRTARSILGANKIYTFRQNTAETVLTQTTVSPYFYNYYTILSNLDQVSSFVTLFDQYRITKVELTFRPMFTCTGLGGTGTYQTPLIYTVVDYDDATSPGSLAAMREYQNLRIHDDKKTFRVVYKPHTAAAAYAGAFTAYQNNTNQWFDCANQAVQYYGCKVGILPQVTGATTQCQQWNLSARLTVEFKNVR